MNISLKEIEAVLNNLKFEDLSNLGRIEIQSIISSCEQFLHLARKAKELIFTKSEVKLYLINQEQLKCKISGTLCIICQSDAKSILLVPCNHLCMCSECSKQLDSNGDRRCPICRKTIDKKIFVYT